MNKEVKFSRFVGIAIVIIVIWVVVLALMSAILKNENNDNLIYVDEGSDTTLNIAKSNIISNYIDMEKEFSAESNIVFVRIRLPKINIESNVANSINERIYAIYQDAYAEVLKTNNIQKIEIDYIYEYLDNDSVVDITIITKKTIDNKIEEKESNFVYDIVNNEEVIK